MESEKRKEYFGNNLPLAPFTTTLIFARKKNLRIANLMACQFQQHIPPSSRLWRASFVGCSASVFRLCSPPAVRGMACQAVTPKLRIFDIDELFIALKVAFGKFSSGTGLQIIFKGNGFFLRVKCQRSLNTPRFEF